MALGALFLALLAVSAAMLSMDGIEGGVFTLVLGMGSEGIGRGPGDGDWAKSPPLNGSSNSTTKEHRRQAFSFMAHFITNDDFRVFNSISR